MLRAKLAITLPEDVWIGDLSRAHPDAEFRVLGAQQTDAGGTGVLAVSAPDHGPILSGMDRLDGVTVIDHLEATAETTHVQFRTDTPLLIAMAESAGLPIQPPVRIVDGTATVWVSGSGERVVAFVDRLEGRGLSVDIQRITPSIDADDLLTDRQRELLLAAVEQGYYDAPRACSLTELAAELDLAESTVSETLHRAEGSVVKAFVATLPAPGSGEDWSAS